MQPIQQTKILGNNGEALVATWLVNQGFAILDRNYQTRLGEVDIIAAKDDVIAFVEVKTRSINYFPASYTVTRTKQRRIIRASRNFILVHGLRDKVFRFDVATVVFSNGSHQIEYIPNAFRPR